jgi:hypothetical protein
MVNFTNLGITTATSQKQLWWFWEQGVLDTTEEDAEEDDLFRAEEGGFCNLTNSILIIYLRLWLNERPGLMNFVSRQIPGLMQVDSMAAAATAATAPASSRKSEEKRRSPDLLADAIKELAEWRKWPADALDCEITASISKMLKFFNKKEEIDLIQVQIEGLRQRMATAVDSARQERYSQGNAALEEPAV